MVIGKSGPLLCCATVAGLALSLGCGGESTAPQSTVPLMQLTVGTTLKYHSSDTLMGTVAAGEQTAADSDFTVRVVRDIADKDGTRWAVLDAPEVVFGQAAPTHSYFGNGPDGLRRVSDGFAGGPVGVSFLIFPYPATRGAIGAFAAVVSTTDTVITVPAGTFHCLRYDSFSPIPGAATVWSVFVAPGTGVVQRMSTLTAYYDPKGQFQLIGRHDRVYRLTALSTP